MTKTEDSSQKRSIFDRDWTKGSILNNLLLLSWPMVVMEALFMIGQVADMIWVGRLGSEHIAGVGIANIILMVIMAMDMGLVIGARAMVARFIGAGDLKGANHTAGQAIILGAVWGLVVTIAGILLSEPVLHLFGLEQEVSQQAMAYLRVIFLGWIAMEVLVMGLYTIQASGDTLKPMIVEATIRTVHVAICPFFVLGLWIFPAMGVSGAALSNIIAHILGAIIILSLLFSGKTRLKLSLNNFRPVFSTIWRILKIGIPALIMHAQRSLGDVVLTWIIVPFGTLAVAAHSLVFRVEFLLFALGIGLGGGAGVLVGQNLGAGQLKRAERSGWTATGVMEACMIILSTAILIWAENIIIIFTPESELIGIGSAFLRIAAVGYLIVGFVFVLQDSIAGAGDTLPVMIVSVVMLWAVQIPLAFFLPNVANLGVYGIRWAIVVATFVGAVFYIVYFLLGRWKLKKV